MCIAYKYSPRSASKKICSFNQITVKETKHIVIGIPYPMIINLNLLLSTLNTCEVIL